MVVLTGTRVDFVEVFFVPVIQPANANLESGCQRNDIYYHQMAAFNVRRACPAMPDSSSRVSNWVWVRLHVQA